MDNAHHAFQAGAKCINERDAMRSPLPYRSIAARFRLAAWLASATLLLTLPLSAEAVPAFAYQTGAYGVVRFLTCVDVVRGYRAFMACSPAVV